MAVIIKAGNSIIVDTDPTVTAVDADAGMTVIFKGTPFFKMTDGENTDVIRMVPTELTSGMVLGSWNPSANLIAHYTLDDIENTTVVKDSSPNSFDGVMIGGNTEDIDIAGLVSVGTAHNFNGSTHTHNIDATILTGNLATATKGTICTVIEPDNVSSNYRAFVCFGDTNANEAIYFAQALDNGKIFALCRKAGVNQWQFETDDVVISNGTKTWIALVQDGTEPFFFIGDVANGMRKVPISFSATLAKNAWFNDLTGLDVGRISCVNFNSGGNSSFYAGTQDDVRIYDSDWLLNDAIGWFNRGNGNQSEAGMVPWTATEALAFLITQSAAYTRNATIVEDRTLLASASATILNNNNVLAALISDLKAARILG